MHAAEEERAEEQNDAGLSPALRFVVGVYGTLGAFAVFIAPARSVIYAWATIFLLAVVAFATSGRTRQVVGSIAGTIMLLVSGWYLYSQLAGGPFLPEHAKDASIAGAFFYFVFFGIPGTIYALKAKFGWRRK